jgi:anti-anti-sigma regulatory factor
MVQSILNKEFSISANSSAVNLVESIKNYISEHDCPYLSMDISNLNIIDASKVTVLCSTYHWAKYPEGKISWKISSPEIKELISPLNLGNIRLINAQ